MQINTDAKGMDMPGIRCRLKKHSMTQRRRNVLSVGTAYDAKTHEKVLVAADKESLKTGGGHKSEEYMRRKNTSDCKKI